jgi:hypothetical protein
MSAIDRSPTASGTRTPCCGRSAASATTSSTGRSSEILRELPEHMEQVQKVTREASEAIRDRFFPTHAEPSWIGETS